MEDTLYDEYMKDPKFASHMKHENEKMELSEKVAALEAELSELREAAWWFANCDIWLNEHEKPEFLERQATLRALLAKQNIE